jgi:Protein of unknown function (DUF2800)
MTEHKLTLSAIAKMKAGGAHSIFGASGSPMYLACAGSLIPNIMAPDDSGPDAAYGTVAHGVTEQWLIAGKPPKHLIGTTEIVPAGEHQHEVEIDEEMFFHAEQCVDRCEWEPGEQLIEAHVDFSHLTPIPNQGGTLDFAAMRPRRATCADHKFGASPENIVYAEENPQLMLYVIGLMRDPRFQHYNFQDFIIRINQPRLRHFDEWHTTRKRLIEFEDYARERMAAAWRFDAPRTPGVKQCRFCKVRGSCAANAKLQEDLMASAFGDTTEQSVQAMQAFTRRLDSDIEPFTLESVRVGTLSTEQMARLLPFRPMAEAWWKALTFELNKRAQSGDLPTTMKIVEGRSKRLFRGEQKVKTELLSRGLKPEQIITEKLVSPAQAEKMLRKVGVKGESLKELMSDLAYKPPGKATLVPLSDRRPAVEDLTALVFETVETPDPNETEEEL